MNPNPRRGLIGMRFNLPARPIFDMVCYGCHRGDYPARRYIEFMRRIGAFKEGPSFKKLETVGIRRDELIYTANLMPPRSQGSKWDAAMARDLAKKGLPFFCHRVDLLFLVGRPVAAAIGEVRAEGLAGSRARLPILPIANLIVATAIWEPIPNNSS